MDSKLLLVRIITLLYLESLVSTATGPNSNALIEEVLTHIKAPEGVIIADFSKDATVKLREVISWMLKHDAGKPIEKSDLLNRIRMATEYEDYIFDSIELNLSVSDDIEEVKKSIDREELELNRYINRAAVMGVFKDIYQMTHFKPEAVDWDNLILDLNTRLEPYKEMQGRVDNSSQVDVVDMSDPNSLSRAFAEGLKDINPEGIIRFGWQGFNRMFGSRGGARRGEMIVVGALQHKFKSGTSLEMLIGAALYNKPHMTDPTKKPLLLRFSLENQIFEDVIHVYRSLIEAETGILIDEDSVDPILAANYVHERLSVNGYNVIFDRRNPSEFTFSTLFKIVEDYERRGYEVHMLNIDYLAMMSTRGCKQGATGQDIRDLFRRVRNFTAAKNILCITPHQLSVEAKKKIREGTSEPDFVREIANKGYYDSCSTIDQEVDMEIYQHLVVINGETYITWMRGKHRKSGKPTPFEDYYTVYKFGTVGFIPYDVGNKDMSRKAVGRAPASELAEGKGNDEWWA